MFKKTLLSAAALLAAGTLSASVFAAPVTAEGTGVGKHGDITVAVTFDAGKIQDIKIVKNAENPILAKKVFTDLKDQVVALSSTDVDLVSGATFSAKGFIDAVNDAAKKAGGNDADGAQDDGSLDVKLIHAIAPSLKSRTRTTATKLKTTMQGRAMMCHFFQRALAQPG